MLRAHIRYFHVRRLEETVGLRELAVLRQQAPELYEDVQRHRRGYQHAIQAVIEEGVASGDFTVTDPQLASLALLGLVKSINVWFQAGGSGRSRRSPTPTSRSGSAGCSARRPRPDLALEDLPLGVLRVRGRACPLSTLRLMASSGGTRRTQAERVAESKQRLLDAAVELIAERGYQATSMAEIAERAGYTRPMVRVRFGSKRELLEELLRTRYEQRLVVESAAGVPGLDRLLDGIDRLATVAREDPRLVRAVFVVAFEALGPVRDMRPHVDRWLVEVEREARRSLEAGQRDGSVRADLDPAAEAKQVLRAALGLSFAWSLSPERVDLGAELAEWVARMRGAYAT